MRRLLVSVILTSKFPDEDVLDIEVIRQIASIINKCNKPIKKSNKAFVVTSLSITKL